MLDCCLARLYAEACRFPYSILSHRQPGHGNMYLVLGLPLWGIPMIHFKFDLDKAISVVSFIATRLKKIKGEADYYTIFKILYFADRDHLAKHGRPIVGDYYCALQDGPIPQNIYDLIKEIKDPARTYKRFTNPEQYFNVINNHIVVPVNEPDMDEISESDLKCLNKSIKENGLLSYDQLKKKSHGPAWHKTSATLPMSPLDIAAEGGADDEMLENIKEETDNERLFDLVRKAR